MDRAGCTQGSASTARAGREGATEREEEDGGEEQEHGTGHAQAQDDGGHDGGAVARRMWKFNTIRPIRYNM